MFGVNIMTEKPQDDLDIKTVASFPGISISGIEHRESPKLDTNNVTILTVNYNTPTVTMKMLGSLFKYYPDIPVVIVDGTDLIREQQEIVKYSELHTNIKLYKLGYNIHHGPGMDYGIRRISTEYIIIVDPDVLILKGGIIEYIGNNISDKAVYIGIPQMVDRNGTKNSRNSRNVITYIHPSLMIVKRLIYGYLLDGVTKIRPFVKHGAPCIKTMTDIYEAGEGNSMLQYLPLINDYFYHEGRGVVKYTGYNMQNTSKKSRIRTRKPPKLDIMISNCDVDGVEETRCSNIDDTDNTETEWNVVNKQNMSIEERSRQKSARRRMVRTRKEKDV